jgi:hypothetical protein
VLERVVARCGLKWDPHGRRSALKPFDQLALQPVLCVSRYAKHNPFAAGRLELCREPRIKASVGSFKGDPRSLAALVSAHHGPELVRLFADNGQRNAASWIVARSPPEVDHRVPARLRQINARVGERGDE